MSTLHSRTPKLLTTTLTTKLLAPLYLLASSMSFANSTTPNSVLEQEQAIKESIIAKVTEAYGGKRLGSLKSITISDYNKGPWAGQTESPNHSEIWRINEKLTIDFVSKRKSMLSWRVSRSGKDLDRFVFDGIKGRIYDILNQKYSEEDWLTYESVGDARKDLTLLVSQNVSNY
jgi:hypothetical protein